jgi:hypothetical protein
MGEEVGPARPFLNCGKKINGVIKKKLHRQSKQERNVADRALTISVGCYSENYLNATLAES